MCCAQLWAARFDRQKATGTTRQRDRQRDRDTERQRHRQTDGHISSTGPHWGPLDPSVEETYLTLFKAEQRLATLFPNIMSTISEDTAVPIATHKSNAESDEDDEDYVPPDKNSDEEEDGAGACQSEEDTSLGLSAGQRMAVDDAFASLFGASVPPQVCADNRDGEIEESKEKRMGERKKKRNKKSKEVAKGKRALRKKRGILSEIFGASAAAKMMHTSATVRDKKREGPLVVMEKRVVTEKKRFAGQEIEIRRTVVKPTEVPGGNETLGDGGAKTEPSPIPVIGAKAQGLDSVLAGLAGPQKITTVAKTSADWDSFKDKTGLEEELEVKAKGKDAFLVKKDFLQRVDKRTFEKEKEERNRNRSAKGR